MHTTTSTIIAAVTIAATLGLAGTASATEDEVDAACRALGAEYGSVITLGNGETANLCQFEDARACTLEAQEAGLCPDHGRKTTGYITEAARYCAWLGGEITTVDTFDAVMDEIDGTCTLPSGTECLIGRLYYGTCD